LDMAGHLLKVCPAPGFIITRSMYDSQLLKSERALFDLKSPDAKHVDRVIQTAVYRFEETSEHSPCIQPAQSQVLSSPLLAASSSVQLGNEFPHKPRHADVHRACDADTLVPPPSASSNERQSVQLHGRLRDADEFEIQMYWGFRPTAHEDLRAALMSCNSELFVAGLALTTIGDVLNDPHVLRSLTDRIIRYPHFRRTIITLNGVPHPRSAEPGGRELTERLIRGRRLLSTFYQRLGHLVPTHIVRPLIDFRTYPADIIPRHFLLRSDAVIYFGSYLTHHEGAHSYVIKIQDHGDGLYALFSDEIAFLRANTVPFDITTAPQV